MNVFTQGFIQMVDWSFCWGLQGVLDWINPRIRWMLFSSFSDIERMAKSKAVTQEAFSETLAKRIMGKLLSQEDQCTLMLISWVASVTSEKTHQQTWLGKFGRAAWRPSPDVDYSYKDTSMHHWAWLWHHGIIVTSAVCMQRSYWPGQGGMAAF